MSRRSRADMLATRSRLTAGALVPAEGLEPPTP